MFVFERKLLITLPDIGDGNMSSSEVIKAMPGPPDKYLTLLRRRADKETQKLSRTQEPC